MADNEKNIWGLHGGKTGDADKLFLEKNFIALGWAEVGDLSKIAPNRDAFKSTVSSVYKGAMKPGAVPVSAGQLFRFVHEIKIGDYVAYPSQRDRHIHIGEIISGYIYDPSHEPTYPNRRQVKWKRSIPRTHFTQGALYEIGSAMSLFLLQKYAHEYLAAVHKNLNKGESELTVEDETVAEVAKDIETGTYVFIVKQLSTHLKGHPLTDLVAHLLQLMGYRTRVSPKGTDGGIDIIAHKDELGFEPPIIKVQVKSSSENVGEPEIHALAGKVKEPGDYGLYVTLGKFTAQAKNLERANSKLRLIDEAKLVEWILEYYDQFDPIYKTIIPLKRVYIAQAPTDNQE